MKITTDFSIPIESLAQLQRFAKVAPNALSPFAEKVEAIEIGDAQKLGLTESNGTAKADVQQVIDVLTTPRACTTVASTDGQNAASHTAYFASDDSASVLVSTSQGALRFRQPAPVESIVGGLEQLIGRSIMGGDDDDDDASSIIDLQQELGLVFAAAIDVQRSTQLAQIANDTIEPVLLTARSVKAQFGRGGGHPQWLVNSLLDLSGITDPSAIDVQACLCSLAQRGLCTEVKDGFVFGDVGEQLSSRTLLMRRMFDVIPARLMPDGSGMQLRFRAHHYGNNEVLIVTQSATNLSFAVRSTAVFLSLIEAAMTHPETLPDFEPIPDDMKIRDSEERNNVERGPKTTPANVSNSSSQVIKTSESLTDKGDLAFEQNSPIKSRSTTAKTADEHQQPRREFVFSASQLQTVINIAGLRPDDGAPLSQLAGERLLEQSPGFDALERGKVIVREGNTLRVESTFLEGVTPLCYPDELVERRSTSRPGTQIYARKSSLAAELTELNDNLLRVAFPCDWPRVCDTFVNPEWAVQQEGNPPLSQFMYEGTAEEAAVLSMVTSQASRSRPVTMPKLISLVRQAIASPESVQPIVSLRLALDLSQLNPAEQVVQQAVKRLIDRKYVLFNDNHFYPVRDVGEAFAHPVLDEMALERKFRTDDGWVSRRMHVVRMSKSLIVMSAFATEQGMHIDWRAITPAAFANYLCTALDWRLAESRQSPTV